MKNLRSNLQSKEKISETHDLWYGKGQFRHTTEGCGMAAAIPRHTRNPPLGQKSPKNHGKIARYLVHKGRKIYGPLTTCFLDVFKMFYKPGKLSTDMLQ